MKKKFISFVLAVCLIFGLTGCGGIGMAAKADVPADPGKHVSVLPVRKLPNHPGVQGRYKTLPVDPDVSIGRFSPLDAE